MNADTISAATTPCAPSFASDSVGRPQSGLGILCAVAFLERLSYYGVRAILVLFIVAPAAHGGLGLRDVQAAAVYGLYIGAAYLTALLGGWLADSWLGATRAVKVGVGLIAIGHGCLAWGTASIKDRGG